MGNPVQLLVPEVGIEPTRTQGPEDFESSASTNFTTPAQFESFECLNNIKKTGKLSIKICHFHSIATSGTRDLPFNSIP
jgi:hypothetical protein